MNYIFSRFQDKQNPDRQGYILSKNNKELETLFYDIDKISHLELVQKKKDFFNFICSKYQDVDRRTLLLIFAYQDDDMLIYYEELPCDLSFKRFAENFRKNNYAEWILRREGMKAYHDKVEPYIERDISKIEVGDILVADGHVLNFQVINPFTGKPTRATLVSFLDWKSTALVGYEIMMTESTQCIASALRNSIINLGMLPKVVYQDNGKAFKSRFFQNTDFEEDLFNGVYANLNIHSVFAKPYNARAKVIERFFREFQEEFEKGMENIFI